MADALARQPGSVSEQPIRRRITADEAEDGQTFDSVERVGTIEKHVEAVRVLLVEI